MNSLFITGASGFIGQSLIAQLDLSAYHEIYCLSRTGKSGQFVPGKIIRVVNGDLKEQQSYADALARCRTVVHLAALTGKAAPEEYFEVNARGTAKLIEQCERTGVENFLYVSTIAVKYQDKSRYHYAQSKEKGEQSVRQSRLRHMIIRPTIVIGKGGGIWRTLSGIARKPALIMPGNGRTLIQPILLDDLVACLLAILKFDLFTNEIVELGGPEKISFEHFLKKIHRCYYGNDPAVWRLPIKPLIATLSLMEKVFASALPVNAGQLTAFWQNSLAEPVTAPHLAELKMTGIDQMLEKVTANE